MNGACNRQSKSVTLDKFTPPKLSHRYLQELYLNLFADFGQVFFLRVPLPNLLRNCYRSSVTSLKSRDKLLLVVCHG